MQTHLSETPQQRADRLLADDQAARRDVAAIRRFGQQFGDFMSQRDRAAPIARPSRWRRIRRALRPWVAGFDNPYMDALWIAFMLYFAALNVIVAAMVWADHRAPLASGAFSADEAASRPAAIPLGGGATGEGW